MASQSPLTDSVVAFRASYIAWFDWARRRPGRMFLGVLAMLVILPMAASAITTIFNIIAIADTNPAGAGDEDIKNLFDTQPSPIEYDAVSSGSGNNSNTLTISHTVASQPNRMLVVTGHARDSLAADCDVTGVTYSAVAMAFAVAATAGADPYYCSELWYLQAPATGTHDIVITWAGTVTRRLGGGISLYNVAQQAPEATASSTGAGVTTITTTTTTATTGPFLVDGVYISVSGGGRTADEPNQVARYSITQSGDAAGSSTRPVAEAGNWDMTWSFNSSDTTHVVAAFAEAQ